MLSFRTGAPVGGLAKAVGKCFSLSPREPSPSVPQNWAPRVTQPLGLAHQETVTEQRLTLLQKGKDYRFFPQSHSLGQPEPGWGQEPVPSSLAQGEGHQDGRPRYYRGGKTLTWAQGNGEQSQCFPVFSHTKVTSSGILL